MNLIAAEVQNIRGWRRHVGFAFLRRLRNLFPSKAKNPCVPRGKFLMTTLKITCDAKR